LLTKYHGNVTHKDQYFRYGLIFVNWRPVISSIKTLVSHSRSVNSTIFQVPETFAECCQDDCLELIKVQLKLEIKQQPPFDVGQMTVIRLNE